MAFQYLYKRGFRCIGFEVTGYLHSITPDVLAVSVTRKGLEVIAVEVKGHRADFRREVDVQDRLEKARSDYKAASALIQETTFDWKLSNWNPEEYKTLTKKRQNARKRIDDFSTSKFYNPLYKQATTSRYIITPNDMVTSEEIPASWGLINQDMKVVKKSTVDTINENQHRTALELIARQNTQDNLKHHFEPRWRLPIGGGFLPDYEELLAKFKT